MFQRCPSCGCGRKFTATVMAIRGDNGNQFALSTHMCVMCGQGWRARTSGNPTVSGIMVDFDHVLMDMAIRIGKRVVRLQAIDPKKGPRRSKVASSQKI